MLPLLMDSPPDTPIVLIDLLTNPDFYLWRFDGPNAIFARMNRDTYKRSIFTDQRIIALEPRPVIVDLDELAQAFKQQKYPPPRLSYIFHVAHCGSTLLARALDLEAKNIVYREPFVLRQLAVLVAENNWGNSPPALWTEAVRLSTTLLAKSYVKDSAAIIKANVPVNFVIDNLMAFSPHAAGLLLYATFDNYLLSILKSDDHRQWVANITTTLGKLIEQRVGINAMVREKLSIAEKAACLWLAQVSIFNETAQKYPGFRTLDAESFFNDPAAVLSASFALFENKIATEEILSIVQSDLFSRHAKMPGQQYDNERRLDDRKQLMQALSAELIEARTWLLPRLEASSISERLPCPLLGESPVLVDNATDVSSRPRPQHPLAGSSIADPGTAAPYLCITPDDDHRQLADLKDEQVIDALKQHGAVLFRGFGYELGKFTSFVNRFCTGSVYNPSVGREIVDAANNIQTVDLGGDAFPLHAELCREPWRPDVCFFACESAPTSGGETTLCDGTRIVESLDEKTVAALQSQDLIYFQPMLADDCKRWLHTEKPGREEIDNPPETCPFSLTFVDGKLTRSFVTPTLHRTMFGKQLAFGNFLLFSRYGLKNRLQPCFQDGSIVPDELVARVKEVSDKLTYAHHWEKGDLLMLDNTRMMHGRNAILNSEERRIISYFGYLAFAELDASQAQMVWRQPH